LTREAGIAALFSWRVSRGLDLGENQAVNRFSPTRRATHRKGLSQLDDMTGGGLSKKTLKLNKKRKAVKTQGAILSKEQRVGKSLPEYKTKTPIERPKPKPRALNETEKRVRALNKKLREIEELQQLEKDGETLDEQQLAKLDSLVEVLAKLEELM
tara:strand:+ start:649 stop:1116 length:468 start_codon:yes stop_codon:yes gene_type:complete